MYSYKFKDGEIYSCDHLSNFKNHRNRKLKKRYGDLRTAYLQEFGVDHLPLCPYCGARETKQINFDEFSSSCGDSGCERQRKTVVNRRLAKERVSRIREKVGEALRVSTNKICVCCGSQFTPNLKNTGRTGDDIKFEERHICYDKYCISILTQHPNIDFGKFREGLRLIQLAISGEDVAAELENIKVHLVSKYREKEVERFRRHLLRYPLYWNLEHERLSFVTNYDYGDGYLYDSGDCTTTVCSNCGVNVIRKCRKFQYLVPFNKGAFCSRKCYWEAKRKGDFIQPLSDEGRVKLSNSMKRLIQEGILTPNIADTWTKRRWVYRGNPFRSSWELIFFVIQEFDGKRVEYEKLRLPYIFNEKERIYIVDFVDHDEKLAYEIKPKSLFDELAEVKDVSLLNWCVECGYTRKLIDETYFTERLKSDILYQYLVDMIQHIENVDPIEFRVNFVDIWRKR